LSNPLLEAIKKRRTQYSLGKALPIPPAEVVILVQDAIRHAPSSYNSQSSRAVILFGEHSERLWSIVKEMLRRTTATDAFPRIEARLDSFAAGAGTVLFFEDQETIRRMQEKVARVAERFPEFAEHSSGMAQFAVWTALANAGIGASLQHYNPLIDAEVARTWQIDLSWRLRSQMPFGSNEAPLPEKTFIDAGVRFKVYGLDST
jgi:predicted oxidoreductase (fatty acid repression mutant protein)